MKRCSWTLARRVVMLLATAALGAQAATAQVRTIDIGGPPADTAAARSCSNDSLLAAALVAFNDPATVRVFGGTVRLPAGDSTRGGYGVFRGALRIDGNVKGRVIVLDGDARVSATGVVGGEIIVLGGRLTVDAGARTGPQYQCAEPVSLMLSPTGQLAPRPNARSLGARASAIGFNAGAVRITPHLGVGEYNRVEALPIEVGANAAWVAPTGDTLHTQAYAILRTARDPDGSRGPVGWHASSQIDHHGGLPFTIGIQGGSTVRPTVDQPFPTIESGLSALLLRRDYSDWYLNKGGSLFAAVEPVHELTFSGAYEISRETTVLAVDAFSILRANDDWRPNPLIDDGTYHILSGRVTYDARDEREHPVVRWYARAEVRDVTSNDLNPVSLPPEIRDAMPTTGYGETEGDFDVRGYLRLNPEQRLNVRVSGGGYLGGDPLTIQRRRAIGGADPLSGYSFRAINCDRRRQPDPATPALCDREMAIQVEYHRALPVDLSARVGPYTVGIHKPDLVILGDAGSAWLAGNSAGRVPTDRIETIGEWHSDLGVGVTTGPVGLYLAKSVVDPESLQVLLLFAARF